MGSTFWLVSLPLDGGSADRTWSVLQDKTTRGEVPSSFSSELHNSNVFGCLFVWIRIPPSFIQLRTCADATIRLRCETTSAWHQASSNNKDALCL